MAQDLTIRGNVISGDDQKALPGASVVLKGSARGTVTDFDGNYSISISGGDENAVLQFYFLGFKTSEEVVGNRKVINVVLNDDDTQLGEIVVTALGIKRQEKALGYAVQNVQGSSFQTVKPMDVGTSLTGKIAGLKVLNSSEFGEAPTIEIRGESPILVIDGVPYGNMSLRDIPSDDIESISVLKGATASALYGYRGASGAIMVTTKRGSAKEGVSVSVNSGTMLAAGYLAIPEIQSTFGRVVNTATNTYARTADGSWGVPMEGQAVIQWDPISKTMKSMPYLPIGKDNFSNFMEQGYVLNNNVNVVQQGKTGSFRSSATWVQNKGSYPNSMFNKYTYSIGGDMKLDKFTLSSSMAYNKQSSPNLGFSGYAGYDPMYSLLVWSAPDWDIRDYKDYWLIENEQQNSSYTGNSNNPYFDRNERVYAFDKDILNGTLALSYDIFNWLKISARTGFDTYSNKQSVRVSQGSFTGAGTTTVISNGTEIWGETAKGSYNTGISRGYSLNNDLLISADHTMEKFSIDGFIGGNIYYRQDEGMEARTQGGLSVPGFYSLKSSINPVAINSRLYRQQVNSLFGRLAVSWNNLIYAEGTMRNDWSSTLPESTRSYLYPSVSSSFVISELLPKYDWLSLWKLRGSWTSSKTPAGIYSINSVYGITQNAWGNLSSATYPSTIRGAEVRPESSATFEVGTGINLFKNRASFDVSYYSKRMYDFLRSTGVSSASGYSRNYINMDEEITRRGLEITARIVPVKTKDWQWDLSFNWSKYAGYYTKLDENFSADKPWVKVNERVDHYILRDYQKDNQGNIIHSNGLPLYSAYDSKYGNYDPDWIWGANTNLRYKNWQMAISMDGRVGGIVATTTEMYMWRSGSHPNSVVPERYLDATKGGNNYIGQGVKVVSGTATYDTYGNITSDTRTFSANDQAVTYKIYIDRYHKGTAWGGAPSVADAYSSTFFKIREISLTYTLPKDLSSKVNAKNLSLSAVGQNVLLWAKDFKYSDPDGGRENFSDPSMRYLGFNVKMDF
ncbi:SusC/RagA family TonB-linked outer membrane protein [Bacteroidales bacterium]|nr:SusC/RagA family TonB-linked outer membrane protein [Bacteroidales bacterium]